MTTSRRSSSSSTLGHQFNGTKISNSPSSSTIHAVANARVYHAQLDAKKDDWTYSRLKGSLSFGRNWTSKPGSPDAKGQQNDEQHWFNLADETTGKTVWMFQIPTGFQYQVDRPFFHVFNGRTRKFGFLFDDDDEASIFSKKVMNEACKDGYPLPKRGRSFRERHHLRSSSFSGRGTIARSQISHPAPNSFRHISHIGVSRAGVFEISKDLDTSFKDMLLQLHHIGREPDGTAAAEGSFVVDFWNDINGKRGSRPASVAGLHPPTAIAR